MSGSVRFNAEASSVYLYLARTALAHAVQEEPAEVIDRQSSFLTRYRTKLGPMTVVTTEEATLEPGRGVRWRHIDGPLTGSVETFRIENMPGGGAVVRYEGEVRARRRWLRGPLERWFVGPVTRMVSMRALREAKRALEGESWTEGGGLTLP